MKNNINLSDSLVLKLSHSSVLSLVVYEKNKDEVLNILKNKGYKNVEYLDLGAYRVLFAEHSGKVYVAFRGTDNKRNVITDMRFVPTKRKGYGWLHRGFYNAFKSVRTELHSELVTRFRPKMRFVFCGHSLGGAMAQIASVWAMRKFPESRPSCITYGSPKVGFASFRKYMRAVKHYRVFNDDDPVTHVPGRWFYKHQAKHNIEVHDGEDGLWDVKEHSMALYRYLITKYISSGLS